MIPHVADLAPAARRRAPSAPAAVRPDRWLAFLRIAVGLWFLKGVVTKLAWSLAGGVFPVPGASARWIGFLPRRLLEYASENPVGWYREFLVDVAVPHSAVFAHLTAFGEAAVGVGLTFGILTGYAALVGLVLMANYFLASFWTGFCQQGFHTLLAACLVAFLGARAGRTWGVDGWLARRLPRLPLI